MESRKISMTRRSVLRLASAAALSLGLPRLSSAEGPTLRMVYYDDFAPYSFLAPDGSATGVFIDALNEVLTRRASIPLVHTAMPWARAQQEVKEGRADAFCTLITAVRREYVNFCREPLYRAENVIVFSKTNPRVAEIKKIAKRDDLKSFTIGTYLGDSRVDTLFKGAQVDLLADMKRVLLKIETHRTDLTVMSGLRWKAIARAAGIYDKLSSIPFGDDVVSEYHLGIRKTYPGGEQILATFDKVLLAARKDGTLGRVIAAYS
jgi:polar amino acid transport system substrate-binding protein